MKTALGKLAIVIVVALSMLASTLAQQLGEVNQLAQITPAQLQQLVAPIALYPDELVAQILAASTYPTQIVEADRSGRNNNRCDRAAHCPLHTRRCSGLKPIR